MIKPIVKQSIFIALSGVIALSGCAELTPTQKGTGIGAGVGAASGAIIGKTTGSDKVGRDAAIGAAVGAIGGYVWSSRMEAQKKSMEQATAGTGVSVSQTADNQLKLDVPSDVSFDVGRADIRSNFRPVLDRFADTLKSNPATQVRVVGYTDSTGSDAVNNPLSVNRAESVREYLGTRGVPSNRVAIDGRGERDPVADNTTEAGRAKNRRVEILVGERGN
ncbi:MAG: glycine zipper family protein [Rhodocyclales bacterium]|nr:glycine zipper family protein [Rhodocyclales bacterium]